MNKREKMAAPPSFICALCGKYSKEAKICSWHTPANWPNIRKPKCRPEKPECEPMYARGPLDAMPITEQGIVLKHMPYPKIDQEVYACCLVPIGGNHPHSEGCWIHAHHEQARPPARVPLDLMQNPDEVPDTWEMSPYTNQEACKEIKEAWDSSDFAKALKLEYVFNSTFGEIFNPAITQEGNYKIWDFLPEPHSSIVINPGVSSKEGVKARAEACLTIPYEVNKAIEALAKGIQVKKRDEGIHHAIQLLGQVEQVEDVWESIVHVEFSANLNIRQAAELAYELGLTAESPVTLASNLKDVTPPILASFSKKIYEKIDMVTLPFIEEGRLNNYSKVRKEEVKRIIDSVEKSDLNELEKVTFFSRAHKMISSDPWKNYLESWKLDDKTKLTQFIDKLREDQSVNDILENATFVALKNNVAPYECCLVLDLALCMVEAYYVRNAIPEILALKFHNDSPVCIVQKYVVIDGIWREMIRQMQTPLIVQEPEKLVNEFMTRYNRIKYITETNPPWKAENMKRISEEYDAQSMLHYDNLTSIVKPFINAKEKIEEKKTEETQKKKQEEDKHTKELLVHARCKLLYLWANWFDKIPERIEEKFLRGDKNDFATRAHDEAMNVLNDKMIRLNMAQFKPGELVKDRAKFWEGRINDLRDLADACDINDLESLNKSFEAFSELLYIDEKIIADIDNIYEREKYKAEKPTIELKEAKSVLLKTLKDAMEYALELVDKERTVDEKNIKKAIRTSGINMDKENALERYVNKRKLDALNGTVEKLLGHAIYYNILSEFISFTYKKSDETSEYVKQKIEELMKFNNWDINVIAEVKMAIENLQKMMRLRETLYNFVYNVVQISSAKNEVDNINEQFLSSNFSQEAVKPWQEHVKKTLNDIKMAPNVSSTYVQELREFAGSFGDHIIFERYKTKTKENIEALAFNTMVNEIYSILGNAGGMDFSESPPKDATSFIRGTWGAVNEQFLRVIYAEEDEVKEEIKNFIREKVVPQIIKVLEGHTTWVATEESVRHIIAVAKGICKDIVHKSIHEEHQTS